MVGSRRFYSCNLKSGFRDYFVGSGCGLCKHESGVFKHYGVSTFSVITEYGPEMKARFMFIALGIKENNSYYRTFDKPNGLRDRLQYL